MTVSDCRREGQVGDESSLALLFVLPLHGLEVSRIRLVRLSSMSLVLLLIVELLLPLCFVHLQHDQARIRLELLKIVASDAIAWALF